MKYTVLIVPDREKEKPTARLRCRVRWEGNVVAVLVGYRVEVAKWSHEAQRCKVNTMHNNVSAAKINKAIDKLVGQIATILDEDGVSKDEFKRRLAELQGKKVARVDFNTQFDEFIADMINEHNWSDSVVEQFDVLRRHIVAHDADALFSSIDSKWLSGFCRYLVESGKRNETTIKILKRLRSVLLWAESRKYVETDWSTFRHHLKTSPHKVVFLDWDELMLVYNAEVKAEYLRHVRDVFCFCCFTSLRYSDVAALTHANVHADRISITTIKDRDNVDINLNKYSSAILARYAENGQERALPVISNQRYNDYVKELMKMLGIDTPISITYYVGNRRIDEVKPKHELITTHTARRTFICNALAMGIAPQIVMKWTGHNDYKSMLPYIDIADKAKADAMKLFDK